jgi:hypothetical protein
VLANRISSLWIYYFTGRINYTTGDCNAPITVPAGVTKLSGANIASADYVVLAVCVDLPAEGMPGSPGYQPASRTLLVTDVALRNATVDAY